MENNSDIAPEYYLWVCVENGKYSKVKSEINQSWDEYSSKNSKLLHDSNIVWNDKHNKIVAVKYE